MKVYAISGLGADERVFKYLNLKYPLVPIDWIIPEKNESIKYYSKRLSKSIKKKEDFAILGVSFGGLVAIEISKLLQPKITILISSIENKYELPLLNRIIGKTGIIKLIPKSLFKPPTKIAMWLFGAKNKSLLVDILNDTDLAFAKWAINQLLNWKNTTGISNSILKIIGSKDKLFSITTNSIIIKNGEHFMIVDKAEELSDIINYQLMRY